MREDVRKMEKIKSVDRYIMVPEDHMHCLTPTFRKGNIVIMNCSGCLNDFEYPKKTIKKIWGKAAWKKMRQQLGEYNKDA